MPTGDRDRHCRSRSFDRRIPSHRYVRQAMRDAVLVAALTSRDSCCARREAGIDAHSPNRDEGALVTEREAWEFDAALARDEMARHFGVASIEGLGIGDAGRRAVAAAGALMRYMHELQPGGVPHLSRPVDRTAGGTMPLDEMTRRNLELVESLRGARHEWNAALGARPNAHADGIARFFASGFSRHSRARPAIDARLDAVALFARDPIAREAVREALDGVRDIERLASKAAAGRGTPRESARARRFHGAAAGVCAARWRSSPDRQARRTVRSRR